MQKQSKNNNNVLKDSYHKYVELYESAPAGYFTLNEDGFICDVNETGAALLSMEKQELINTHFSRYISPKSQVFFVQYCRQVFNEKSPLMGECELIRWTGPTFYAQLESKKTMQGAAKKMLILVTDITQQKIQEECLRQQYKKVISIDRICSMNEVAFSILHPLNESITIIDNYIYGCARRLESGNYTSEELLHALKKISGQSNYLVEMVLRMKSYTAKDILRYEVVNLDEVLKEAVAFLHQEAIVPIKIHYEVPHNLPEVKIDKSHIQHVILNLVRNAMESMQEANVKEPQVVIKANVALENKHAIEVSLLDNGPGYKPEIAEKLFDPHFTTKPYNMGLGLTICRAIIEKHGGQLRTNLLEAGGTCFQFILPCISIPSKRIHN